VHTATAAGEHVVHNRVAQWLTWADRGVGVTLVFTGTNEATRADPWFARVEDYPGIGSQLAARDPLTLPAGGAATRGLRTLSTDGALDNGAIQTWADATAPDPRPGHATTGPHNPAAQAGTRTGRHAHRHRHRPARRGSASTRWRG
jgi:hypothetical protein